MSSQSFLIKKFLLSGLTVKAVYMFVSVVVVSLFVGLETLSFETFQTPTDVDVTNPVRRARIGNLTPGSVYRRSLSRLVERFSTLIYKAVTFLSHLSGGISVLSRYRESRSEKRKSYASYYGNNQDIS